MHKQPSHNEPRTVNLHGTHRKLKTSQIARENNVRQVAVNFRDRSSFRIMRSKCFGALQL